MTGPHINTDERKAAFQRSNLWRIGMSFERAQSIDMIRRCLDNAAIEHRKRHATPAQPVLI